MAGAILNHCKPLSGSYVGSGFHAQRKSCCKKKIHTVKIQMYEVNENGHCHLAILRSGTQVLGSCVGPEISAVKGISSVKGISGVCVYVGPRVLYI